MLCMNAAVDSDLLKLVQQHVNTLKSDVNQLTFEVQEDKERVSKALKDISTSLEELEARVANVQHEQEVLKQKQSDVDTRVVNVQRDQEVMIRVDAMQTAADLEDVQQRDTHMEKQRSSQSCPEENQDRGMDNLVTRSSG